MFSVEVTDEMLNQLIDTFKSGHPTYTFNYVFLFAFCLQLFVFLYL